MPNSQHVIIVPCGQAKLKHRARARDLYVGSLFRANMAWAVSVAPASSIFILSAKHGLIDLNTPLDPYNLKMGDEGSVTPETIRNAFDTFGLGKHKIYALGGSDYLKALSAAWIEYCAPCKGLSLGYQIQRMRKNVGHLPKWRNDA